MFFDIVEVHYDMVNYVPIPRKIFFIVRPVLAVRPSSVTDHLRGEREVLHHLSL